MDIDTINDLIKKYKNLSCNEEVISYFFNHFLKYINNIEEGKKIILKMVVEKNIVNDEIFFIIYEIFHIFDNKSEMHTTSIYMNISFETIYKLSEKLNIFQIYKLLAYFKKNNNNFSEKLNILLTFLIKKYSIYKMKKIFSYDLLITCLNNNVNFNNKILKIIIKKIYNDNIINYKYNKLTTKYNIDLKIEIKKFNSFKNKLYLYFIPGDINIFSDFYINHYYNFNKLKQTKTLKDIYENIKI